MRELDRVWDQRKLHDEWGGGGAEKPDVANCIFLKNNSEGNSRTLRNSQGTQKAEP